MNNKTLLGVLAVGGIGILGYCWYKKHHNASPVLMPSANGTGSSSALSGGYSTDILALLNRLDQTKAFNLRNLISELSSEQMAMLDSIAHSWNNGIGLTPEQTQFWSTVGVF